MNRDRVRDEFDQFVAASVEDLVRTAYLVVWDLAEAEDLVQECLLRVARRWPRVRSMQYPRAYTRQVLVNLALKDTRHRSRSRSELDPAVFVAIADVPDQGAERALGSVETTEQLITVLGQLSGRQRATLVLRYFLDLSENEVAELMGCSVGTVKSTASRALESLRRQALAVPAEHTERAADPAIPTRGARRT